MTGPIDLFLVAGQSNAQGYGDSTLAPATVPGMAYERTPAGVVKQLTGATYGANTGSAWAAFANELTGHSTVPMCVTIAAVGSTTLLAEHDVGSGNWSPTGTLFSTSVTRAQAAQTQLEGEGWSPTFRGVLWSQGEYDGMGGNSDPATLRATYEAAFADLGDRYRAAFGPSARLFVWRTGIHPSYKPGFAAVRDAQEAVCAADPSMVMAYTGTLDFPSLGLMRDSFHYNQAGLNLMGTDGALAVATDLGYYVPPEPPATVGRTSTTATRLLRAM